MANDKTFTAFSIAHENPRATTRSSAIFDLLSMRTLLPRVIFLVIFASFRFFCFAFIFVAVAVAVVTVVAQLLCNCMYRMYNTVNGVMRLKRFAVLRAFMASCSDSGSWSVHVGAGRVVSFRFEHLTGVPYVPHATGQLLVTFHNGN